MNLILEVSATAPHFPVWATLVIVAGFIAATTIGSFAWFRSKRPLGWEDGRPPARRSPSTTPRSATRYDDANYDRGITAAETGARQDREGANFKTLPDHETDTDLDTTEGYTVDREGLLNNYAIEPEMYIEEPGDLAEKHRQEVEARVEELQEINRPGGKGPGLV